MVVALPLADAAVAVVGLLLIAAAVPLAQLTVALLSQIPVIGGPAGKVAYTAFLSGVSVLVRWSQQSADAAASVIQGPIVGVWTMVDALVTEDWQITQTIYALATVTIPRLVGWTFALVTQQIAYVLAQLGYVEQWLVAWVSGQLATIAAELVQVVSWTAQSLARVEAALGAQIAAGDQLVARYAEQLAVDAIQHADQVAITAEHYAAASAIAVERYAEQLVGTEAQRAAGAEQALRDYAGAIGRALEADISAAEARATAAAAAGTAVVATAVQAIENSPCIRNCGPLGEIGQLATDLEGAGLLAILLGLLAQATTDPQGVAEGMRTVLVEPAQAALAGLGVKVPQQ